MSHRKFWAVACVALFGCFLLSPTTQAQKPRGKPGQPGAGQMQIPPQVAQQFDANGNGQLDPDEQQAAMQYLQKMQGGQGQGAGAMPGGRGRPGAGRPGAGGPGGAGMGGAGMGQGQGMGMGAMMNNPQMQQQLLQRFDKNGNGQLDPDEQQTAMQAWQQMQGGQGAGTMPGGKGRPGAGGQGAGGPGAGMGMGAMLNNPQMQQQLLQKFDKNGNGQLDPDEQQAAMQAWQQMQGGQTGGRPGGRPGAGPPGAGGPAGAGMGAIMNNPQMQQQLLQKFDKNGNGQLDPDELQAAQQAMQQMQGGQNGRRPQKK